MPKPKTPVAASLQSDTFVWPVRVYYEDTDAGGVVYYANYLKFMERARTEWLRMLGFGQTVLAREQEVVFVVRALTMEYLKPARFEDQLDVTVKLLGTRGSLIEIAQAVWRGAHIVASADVRLACVNTRSFRPVRIPRAVLEKIATGEA